MGNFEPGEIESSNKPGEGGLAYELPPDQQVTKICNCFLNCKLAIAFNCF